MLNSLNQIFVLDSILFGTNKTTTMDSGVNIYSTTALKYSFEVDYLTFMPLLFYFYLKYFSFLLHCIYLTGVVSCYTMSW